jgi:hypothetical protein
VSQSETLEYCRAFDRDSKQIGTFENINVGAAALLELAITTGEGNG